MSIFPTNILLATDGSREATLATSTAVQLSEGTNSELHVVFVMHPREYLLSEDEILAAYDAKAAQEEAERAVDYMVDQIEGVGGTVAHTHLRRGRPDAQIVAVAEELASGLIVMGSRGRGGLRRSLMGSVSDSVIRHAHCAVLVVRE
jgi:nucleotide-binding universal stress UspA family protein